MRFAEELFLDQLFQQPLACRDVYLPEPTGLRDGESKPWHLAVLAADTSDERFMPRVSFHRESDLAST
jgi:hypothetical protein